MELNYQEKVEEIVNWIRKTVQKAGFSDVVIALSGGIDSAVSATLAVKALGKEHVYVLLLPYGDLSSKGTEDALLVAKYLGLSEDQIITIDIRNAVDQIMHSVIANESEAILNNKMLNQVQDKKIDSREDKKIAASQAPRNDALRRGNIMARARMIYLFDLAKSLSALVVGTENKTEHYLGYFTRFGDEASDIEPIRSLYKTQVWEMAKYLRVPSAIITKAPSANLWEGQSDEGEFGFSYADADKVLSLAFDEGMRNGDIVKAGIDEKIVRIVLDFASKNAFKRHVPHVFE